MSRGRGKIRDKLIKTFSLYTSLASVFSVQSESKTAEIRGYGSGIEKLRGVAKVWNMCLGI